MSRRIASHRRVPVALLIAAMGLLVAAGPAGAYLRDLTVKQQSTGSNSTNSKRELVPVTGCPGPIIGGAAFVSPGLPNLGLNRLMPFGGLLTGAIETDAESARWALHSRAFCVANTAITPNASGNPASYLKALQYVSASSGSNSSTIKSVIAKCPAGKTVVGGGGRILAAGSNYAFQAMQRAQANTAWRVVAREVDSTPAGWQVQARAICADVSSASATANYVGNATAPSGGFTQQVNPSTNFDSGSPKTVVRTCPAGTRPVGGGAWVLGFAFESPVPSDVVITSSDLVVVGNPPSLGWRAEARETDPTNAEWRLNAHVACAPLNGAP